MNVKLRHHFGADDIDGIEEALETHLGVSH